MLTVYVYEFGANLVMLSDISKWILDKSEVNKGKNNHKNNHKMSVSASRRLVHSDINNINIYYFYSPFYNERTKVLYMS